ncbi:hypothetical protein KQ313_12000 [Synechococcus sp. CS-1325]|nr:hypothetical protein [Synechococcus sp. CS-1325]
MSLASNVAAPKNTGGGGFVFENDVCAFLLASMLVGDPVFGADCGVPMSLDFQTRPDGWFLDDILVTTAVGDTHHRFALSVKSNTQFTATSAPSDFVAAAWEQWLHIKSAVFDATLDFIGLVTAPLSAAAEDSVSGLMKKVIVNDPGLFPGRLATPKWATADERALFASFTCPAALGRTTTDVDTAALLKRLRFLQFDFDAIHSNSQSRALELCRRAVRSHTLAHAQALWSVLQEVASELRPKAGSLSLRELIERLRARALLADYPDHARDWAALDERSAREVGLVRNSIADRVRIPREDQVTQVIKSLSIEFQVVLLGASGLGKSALAKSVFERRNENAERTLWVDASSLDRAADFGAFETSLQLLHPLADLLGQETSREPVVIIDGLDRLYSDHSFRNVASLLRSAGGAPNSTRWRVLAICQSQEWPRVLEALQRAGASISSWHNQNTQGPEPADLEIVSEAAPTLRRLILQPRIGKLLTNLKLLDLVVRRLLDGTDIDPSALVGESSIAEWFWSAEVDRGSERLSRGQFVRSLAQTQADQLTDSVSVDSLNLSSLIAAKTLCADQLLVQKPGDRLAFAHDLYGDWARLRILLNHRTDLAAFLQGRHESPLWHRAIRLFGIHMLERENGVHEWKSLMSLFDSGEMKIVRDLLLEAPAFSMNAGPLLGSIFPDLVAGDGRLLQRLLTRFLAFATVPNEQMLELARSVGMDNNAARATYRCPHWPYWIDVLEVLHAHRVEALYAAPFEIAKVVEMWLEFVPPGSIRRREAAELAVMLGQRALDSRDDYRGEEERGRHYKCALLAAPERPDEIAELAKTAAERIPRPVMAAEEATPLRLRSRSMFSTGIMRGPWPDGPLRRVDEVFQNVILDSLSIQHLYRVRPSIAVEIILATLIEAPYEVRWGGSRLYERELDLVNRHKWQPVLYTQGPFLGCLRMNFAEGLELIMRLLDFATERARERAEQYLSERRARESAEGHNEIEDTLAMAASVPWVLLLKGSATEDLIFQGDESVYGWSSGLGNPPDTIEAALMALEQYFYACIDAGENITKSVVMTFARSRSVAALGVLCDVGKRQPELFNGPLRALLSAPELYSWEITKQVSNRTHMMIGASMKGQVFFELAKQFHGLEHRKYDIRYIASDLLLKSEEMQSFFCSVRAWWKKRHGEGEQLASMSEQLDLRLDPANWQMREDPTHGLVIANVALERVQAEKAGEMQVINDRMLRNSFPMRCRSILDERQLQADAELEEFWQEWNRIRKLADAASVLPGGEERLVDLYIDALTGGIAVMIWRDDWLSRHTTRREEVERVLDSILTGEPPKRTEYMSSHDVCAWSWDCFLAESVAMLWARDPQDARWRRLVAQLLFAEKYKVVSTLFSRCAEHRTILGDDFGRLRRLAIDWAHVRGRVDGLRNWQYMLPEGDVRVQEHIHGELATWQNERLRAFVDGTLAPLPVDWNRFEDASRFAEIDTLSSKWPDFRLIDFHLVRCSHGWLPLPNEALSEKEREVVIQFWRVALNVVAARPRSDLQRDDHQYPHADEEWVLENVAAVLLQLRPTEEPELFWAVIIDLHSEAHDWPKKFLNALHRCALSSEQTPASYSPLIRQIVQRAFSDIDGTRRWPLHKDVWDALIGIHWWVSDLWDERHAQYVITIWDVISCWMEKAPQNGGRLGKFARWLAKPAAGAVRVRTLTWFQELLHGDEESSAYRYEDFEDDLAKLLNVVWDQDQIRLRTTGESFAAFQGLLAWLVERQNSLGLELQGRIGGLI